MYWFDIKCFSWRFLHSQLKWCHFSYHYRANLSHDYFTNRQDRYVVIEDCADLSNFYVNLVSQICKFSFQLLPNGSTSLHSSWSPECHPFKGNKKKFIEEARKLVWEGFAKPLSKADNAIKEYSKFFEGFYIIQWYQI